MFFSSSHGGIRLLPCSNFGIVAPVASPFQQQYCPAIKLVYVRFVKLYTDDTGKPENKNKKK